MFVDDREAVCGVRRHVSVALVASLGVFAASGCAGDLPPVAGRPITGADCGVSSSTSGRSAARFEVDRVLAIDGAPMLTMGIVANKDTIYIFDRDQGRVVVADRNGRTMRTMSRSGHGPGEILPRGAIGRTMPKSQQGDWIDSNDEVVAVFDGLAVHLFSLSGARIDDVLSLSQASIGSSLLFTTRMRRYEDSDIVDIESLRAGSSVTAGRLPGRAFSLYRLASNSAHLIFTLGLVDPPVLQTGAGYHGPQQASPLWDLLGRCAVVTDGGSDMLHVFAIESEVRDSLLIHDLPVPEVAVGGEAELLPQMGVGGKAPDPTQLKRIARLKVDPAGWIWLELWKRRVPGEPVAVIRVHLGTGAQVRDTVPAFPSAFLTADEYVGVRRTADGDRELVRVRRR